jgi:hypothetical protein
MVGVTDVWIFRWIDGWMDGWTEVWRDNATDMQVILFSSHNNTPTITVINKYLFALQVISAT